jgi:nitroreductase
MAIVTMDRRFGLWAAIDVGCWLQTFLLACTDEGLATCPQATLGAQPQVAREVLKIDEQESVLFGVAVGWEDGAAPANRCRTSRGAVGDNVHFRGF